jgi:ABC-type xylose transport system permease subunit
MKPVIKIIQLLAILELLLLAAGYLILSAKPTGVNFFELLILSLVFTIIFFRGQQREPGSQALHSLVAVTIKFLSELILAFVWFFIAKKRGIPSVVLFFVLYLTFTLFSILIMVKTLKNKNL